MEEPVDRDPLWENVNGYMGVIRNYNPEDWTILKQEEILELYLEVIYDGRVYWRRFVMEFDDIDYAKENGLNALDIHLTQMIEYIDKKLERRRRGRTS